MVAITKAKYILIFVYAFQLPASLPAMGQKQGQERIDSLMKELPGSREDTIKVKLLGELSIASYPIDPNKAQKFAALQLKLAEKLNWKEGIAWAHNNLGVSFWAKSDYAGALDHYFAALKYAEAIKNKYLITTAMGNVGIIYFEQGNYEKALETDLKVIQLFEELGDQRGVARNLGNIGEVYAKMKNYKKALEEYSRALVINEKLGRKSSIAYNLVGIGEVYTALGNYDQALENFFQALEINRALKNKINIANCYSLVGDSYLKRAKSNSSNSVLLKEILIKSWLYTDSSIAMCRETGTLSTQITNYRNMSEISEMLSNYPAALTYYQQFSVIKDSVFNLEKGKKITQAIMQYDYDKKEELRKAKQDKKEAIQRNIRNGILIGLAGTLFFLFWIFRQRNKISKEKKRSDALLLNILPAEVAEELKAKGHAEAKSYDMATVMFTDFKGFTAITEKLSPDELIAEINVLFRAFDEIVTKHHIEKIKTIGDSYMCAAGLPLSNSTHAYDMIMAAREIQSFMFNHAAKQKKENKPVFEIRIGIHSGPVVAGIVGIKKFAYDIWGDTVNIASRMESSGEPGKVNISGSTYNMVKNKFNCVHRGKIQAKNKGEIDMYFVETMD